MRLKLDENLPARLVPILVELGHDVDTVVREGLKGAKDDDLWPAVQKAERFLITKDLGFSDVRRYPPGHPPRHHRVPAVGRSQRGCRSAAGTRLPR